MAWVWITEVVCHPEVEHKIWINHHLRLDEVREAVCFGAGDEERWHDHPQYGRRLLVKHETYLPLDNLLIVSATNRPGHPRRSVDPQGGRSGQIGSACLDPAARRRFLDGAPHCRSVALGVR